MCRALARELARTGGASPTGKACTRLLALVRVQVAPVPCTPHLALRPETWSLNKELALVQGGGVGELRGLRKAVAEAAGEVDDAVGKKALAKCAAAVADALVVAHGAPPHPPQPETPRPATQHYANQPDASSFSS